MIDSLWGNEFVVEPTINKAKKIKEKISNPKTSTGTSKKSKVSLTEQLDIIKQQVNNILGVYKDSTVVIKSKEQLHDYITEAIKNKIIAIDTETNNSLDPITCKLMGPCIYTPGQKNAYIPLNHRNPHTNERLDWQITEQDFKNELDRLDNTPILMHNGKFDYQVIKCTTGKQLKCFWDTMLAARVLDENERSAGLKQQYIQKIDPSIEKYDIEHLFEGVEYAVVDPEVFALYAATDAYMTYKLYEWQKKQFEKSEHEKLYKLFLEVEMPVMEVAAEMELTGICIDEIYAERLSNKYHKMLEELNLKIDKELDNYTDIISKWRTTDDAQFKPEKVTKTGEKKFGKSKSEQLDTPVNLSSPTQLAIFFYDILNTPVIDKASPRSTGVEVLKRLDLPICKLILEQRGLLKLINTYIDKLPLCLNEKDNRLHAHFNQTGTDTGRFSSSDPNLQNIPSKHAEIRMLFTAGDTIKDAEVIDNTIKLYYKDEVFTDDGYKAVKDLHINDVVVNDDDRAYITNIDKDDKYYTLYFQDVV